MPPADILCLWAKPRWRSILREEEFGEIKTLKRLDHTNPSVDINGMNDYQATYSKRWQNQSFLSVNLFTFVGSRPPQHSWPAAATPNQVWWNAEFWVDDRLRPCKHISLQLPSPIFIVGLSTRVGGQPNWDSTCFSGCEFFLQSDFIIAMIHILTCQICILGSVVRALHFTS